MIVLLGGFLILMILGAPEIGSRSAVCAEAQLL